MLKILESYWKMLLDVHMCTLILLENLLKESCTEMASSLLSVMHVWKKNMYLKYVITEKYKHYKEYYYYDTITMCIIESTNRT